MELIGVFKENDFINQEYILDYFSTVERDRVYGKSSIESRKCTFLGILLLKYLIKDKVNREITIHYPTLDKPILLDKGLNNSSYDFSISHSDELVFCIISKNKIGIDVEKIKTVNFHIMELIFSEDEIDYVLAKENHRNERFFQIWTMKESYIKLLGQGLKYSLRSLNLIQNSRLVQYLSINGEIYYFKRLTYDDYIVSICSNVKIDVDLNVLNERKFYLNLD